MFRFIHISLAILAIVTPIFGLVDTEQDGNYTSGLNCSSVSGKNIQEIRSYKSIVQKIINAVISGEFKGTTYKDLEYFVDNFGNRLTGSEALEKSIDFMLDKMKAIGLDDVHAENVTAPKWVRGEESATMLNPWYKKLSVLGLAFGVETPAKGITAEIIVVDGFKDLKNVKNATGKILVYNQPFEDPEKAIKYRQLGAIEAAKLGAVATLVRSYATFSLSTPHTGLLFYANDTQSIPAGEISIEDAELLYRLYKKGQKVVIHLNLRNEHKGNITTRNSIGDRTGTVNPDEFLLISGHIDSYDVGQGALDDGYGVILSVKANEVLDALNLTTRRTIRTILWTAEETGEVPYGAAQYIEAHRAELEKYTMFLEADSGIFEAHGLIFNGSVEAGCLVEEILRLFEPELVKTTKLYPSFPRLKTDIVPLMGAVPVPGALIATNADKYFWYHHSNADTMSAIDSKDLDVCLAMWSALSYVLADLSFMLPRKA